MSCLVDLGDKGRYNRGILRRKRCHDEFGKQLVPGA